MIERMAVISDIHGNMPALEAVIDDIENRNITRIICLGDLAGKGPSPAEVVDKIQDYCEVIIKGNWDYYLTEQASSEVLSWHRKELGVERLKYLKELPLYHEFYISGKLLRLCHASPNNLFHRVYLSTEQGMRLKLFEPTPTLNVVADVVGYGDIHSAHIDHFMGKTIFNVGSVGNPLDGTQASYGIIEGELDGKNGQPFIISLVKVPYDIELAIEHSNSTDLPEKLEYINELRTGIYRGRKA